VALASTRISLLMPNSMVPLTTTALPWVHLAPAAFSMRNHPPVKPGGLPMPSMAGTLAPLSTITIALAYGSSKPRQNDLQMP
jgi:hypothetical protein